MGWTLNMATMMGLLLAVGMVVDNAIRDRGKHLPATAGGRRCRLASINGAG
jgi:hypothetical protein